MYQRVKTSWVSISIAICFLTIFVHAEDAAAPTTSKDICKECFCDSVTPFFINCESLKLTELYSEADWNMTLEAYKLNITETTTLDFRINDNLLTRVTKFPPLNISLLTFSNNNISSIEDSAFAELDYLDWLDLSINSLTAVSLTESAFYGKYNATYYFPITVKHLNLSHNQIHVIGKDFFDHMPSLITLDISHNPLVVLSGATSAAISSLIYLQALVIRHASVSDMPAGMLHSLLNLKTLDISGNEFTKVPSEISFVHNLTALDISFNKFDELNNESFLGLDYLEDLYINYMVTLKHIGSATFGPLKKLVKIEITHNRNLNEISDAAFLGMVNASQDWPVKEMHLNDNGLTHIDQALAAWEYVDHVDIQNNPFRCDCRSAWMIQVLVDKIRREDPLLTNNIVCAEPEELKGRSLISLSIEPEELIRCRSGESEINGDANRNFDKDPYQTAGVTILVIGIMLIVIGVSILAVIFVKRRAIALALMNHQQIRYERAGTDDIEYTNRYGYTEPK